jgi:hypothetical protein
MNRTTLLMQMADGSHPVPRRLSPAARMSAAGTLYRLGTVHRI